MDGRVARKARTPTMIILKGHTNPVRALAFSPDGRHLLTGSNDEPTRLWDLTTGSVIASFSRANRMISHALFLPNRGPMQVLFGDGYRLSVWEPGTGREQEFPVTHASAIAAAPDGTYLATVQHGFRLPEAGLTPIGRAYRGEGGLHCWDPGTGELITAWPSEPQAARCLAFSSDGKLLATGCLNGTVILWDTSVGKPIGTLGQPARSTDVHSPAAMDQFISRAAFAGESRTLVTATSQTLAVWDATTRQALATHRHKGKHYQGIAVSPDGRLLATANNDATVRFRLLPGLEERKAFTWKIGPILDIAFAPDGCRCAAAGRSGKVIVWDVDD
jgi:WD40 repeat protein